MWPGIPIPTIGGPPASSCRPPAGGRSSAVLDARRAWIASLFEGWDRADLGAFASALGRFSTTLEGETADTE